MKKLTAIAASAIFLSASSMTMVFAAEPIVGTWKRSNGTSVKFAGSGGRYCGKVVNGKYAGQSIGCMKGKGKSYRGSIKVLDEGKTYTGKAYVSGSSMKLSGCVLKVLCKSETLRRQ